MSTLPTTGRAASGTQVELRSGGARAVVVEVGAGLRRFSVDGSELVDGYDVEELAAVARGQILTPWPNRVRDGAYEFEGGQYQLPLTEPEKHNAIHGLTRWVNWAVTERTDTHARFEYQLHPQPGFPFNLALAVDYQLDAEQITVRTEATNVGRTNCPFGAGAHPYLTVGTERVDSCTLTAPGKRWMRTDERLIPTGDEPVDGTEYDFRSGRTIGNTQLDTGYDALIRDGVGRAHVSLADPEGGRRLTLWQEAPYRYLMLFTGDTDDDPARRRRSLGVEPMTCAPNALQTGEGLLTLVPGASFSGAWGIAATTPR